MEQPAVLIIDDDPSHLRIYGWIIQMAGYRLLPALVTRDNVELPNEPVSLVLLDYHLNGRISAMEVARLVKCKYSGIPILVLSDAPVLPADITPLVDGFVRKGDPARLVETVSRRLGGEMGTTSLGSAEENGETPRRDGRRADG